MTTNSNPATWLAAGQRPPFRIRFFVTIPFLVLMLNAVDVYVAPFVAYASYRIAHLLNKKFDPAIRSY